MRKYTLIFLGISLLSCTLEAQSHYRYSVDPGTGFQGETVEVNVYLDNTDTISQTAWSFGICHNPMAVSAVSATDGAATIAVNPVFSSVQILPHGVTMGVVVAFIPGANALAPGVGLELLNISYLLDGTPGMSSLLPCSSLGSPPVASVVVPVGSPEVAPDLIPSILETLPPKHFVRGDANQDGFINIVDAVRMLELQFFGIDPILCADQLDANDDGSHNLADPVMLLSFLYAGAAPLPPPFPSCGGDSTSTDLLDCAIPPPNCP